MRCLPVLMLVLALARPADAAPTPLPLWKNGGPRVRPADSRIATLLLDGLRRSPALVAMVDRVENSDVIVYLEIEPTLTGRLAGCLTWMGTTGGYRYVRASLNPNQPADILIAAIGHELQHAIEIADNPEVTDPDSLRAFYQRIGNTGSQRGDSGLDTLEARQAGALVRANLRAIRAAGAIGTETVSPRDWHVWYRQQRLPEGSRP
jgi:hypothetical protein